MKEKKKNKKKKRNAFMIKNPLVILLYVENGQSILNF